MNIKIIWTFFHYYNTLYYYDSLIFNNATIKIHIFSTTISNARIYSRISNTLIV